MAWNLHLTGEADNSDLTDVLNNLVADLERIGHTLTSATLTTDDGQTDLPVTPPAEDAPASDAVAVDTPPTLPDS